MKDAMTRMAVLGVMLIAVGCASGGGSHLDNTIYDTHQNVQRLSQNLDGSVTKLNETTAELIARVNASDQQARTLQGMLEENQVKIENIQRALDNLIITLHRQLNLSPPSSMTPPSVPGYGAPPSEIEVEAPRVSPPPSSVAPVTPSVAPSAPVSPQPGAVPQPIGNPEEAYQRAQRSYANEDYALALEQFDAYLQRYPNTSLCANAQFWKGYCYYHLGKPEDAIVQFEKLRTQYPDDEKVPFGMHIQAMAHKQLGQTAQAIALLREVVEKYPATAAGARSKTELGKLQGN